MQRCCGVTGCQNPATKIILLHWLFGPCDLVTCDEHFEHWHTCAVLAVSCDDNGFVSIHDFGEVSDEPSAAV